METEEIGLQNLIINDKENENGNTSSSSEEEYHPDETLQEQESVDSLEQSSFLNQTVNTSEITNFDDLVNNCPWTLGQLAWARMHTYPFWPCVVTQEPSAEKAYKKVQSYGRTKTLMIHVHFFNDNGRRSWVPSHNMFEFNGIEDFRKRSRSITDAIRKKEPKFAAALTIKPSIFHTWQLAVAEAMDVLEQLDFSSLEIFKPKLNDMTNKVTKSTTKVNRKRKRKEDEDKSDSKIRKKSIDSNDSYNGLQPNENTNGKSSSSKNSTPRSSTEDLRTFNYKKQKRIEKLQATLNPPDFNVYYERNLMPIKERFGSDATDELVREYLQKVWAEMSENEKQKYRRGYRSEKNVANWLSSG